MSGDRFRLQAVLEQRERIEGDRRRDVAELERRRVAIEDQLTRMQSSLETLKVELRQALTPGEHVRTIDPRQVRAQAGASLHAQARAQGLAIELAGVHQQLNAARQALRRASAERKAVELLRQRWRDARRRAEERRETVEQDEMSTARRRRADLWDVETGA